MQDNRNTFVDDRWLRDGFHVMILTADHDLGHNILKILGEKGYECSVLDSAESAVDWEQQHTLTINFYIIDSELLGKGWKEVLRCFHAKALFVNSLVLLDSSDMVSVREVKAMGVFEVFPRQEDILECLPGVVDKWVEKIYAEIQLKAVQESLRLYRKGGAHYLDISPEESVFRAKSELLTNLNHEMRNPLNALVGMARMLENTTLNNEQNGYLKSILLSSENLTMIIKSLLDYSGIIENKPEVVCRQFFVRDMIGEVVDIYSVQAKEKNNTLFIRIEPDVPQCICSDKQKIQLALNNLISNAVKFTTRGEITVGVCKVVSQVNERGLMFSVRDTGIGVRRQDIGLMFDSFHQLDNSSRKEYKGAGLGLSIVKNLVDLMGGKVGFESKPGKGSLAFFTVPLTETYGGQVSDPCGKEYAPRKKPLNILVVEDDANNSKYMSQLLRLQGWDVETAFNGLEALELFAPEKYDLIMMDGQMPKMDGFEATKKIREVEGNELYTPILAISGYAIPGDRERFIEAGMDDYISKPVDEHKLLRLVCKLTGSG